MPVIELEEVQMVETSDESLEAIGGSGGSYYCTNFNTMCDACV
jgi:hypothetical protein